MIKSGDASFEKALMNPGGFYKAPEDVLQDDRLTPQQKSQILENWMREEENLNRKETGRIREAVGIFDNEKDLEAAIVELEATAFPRHDISVLGNTKEMRKTFGASAVAPEEIEDNPDAPRGIPVMPEEKAIGGAVLTGVCAYIGGCIAAVGANSLPDAALLFSITAGSVAGGAIGLAGALFIRGLFKRSVRQQIKKGGLVLWVNTPQRSLEKIACAIMEKHGGRHIHIHKIE
jgi:hypothetical protein